MGRRRAAVYALDLYFQRVQFAAAMRQQFLAALVGQEQAIERYALRLDLRQQLLQLLLSLFIAQTADIFGFFSHFEVLGRQTCLSSS